MAISPAPATTTPPIMPSGKGAARERLPGDQGGGSRLVHGGDPAAVERVVVVHKTHLDLGFTDLAAAVVRRYVEDFIPRALALAADLRAADGPRFCWTTGSWLIDTFLERTDAAGRRAMEAGIAAGDIAWHALPFTLHTELADPGLVRAGLAIARRLDRRFGRRTIAAKMTDVPGHTRGLVPLLVEAGVDYLHLGVNPFSRPLDVPPLFRWRVGDSEIVVHYDAADYGCTTVAGRAALALEHSGDNQGPQDAAAVRARHAALAATFPAARIEAGRLDDFAALLAPLRAGLPVVSAEAGDSWIHGAASAPRKLAGLRALLRCRATWTADDPTLADSGALDGFDDRLLQVVEHTWGWSRARLDDYERFERAELAALRASDRGRGAEASWREQAALVPAAAATLPAPLRAAAEDALAATVPLREPPRGTAWDPAAPVTVGELVVALDPASGAIADLRHGERQWSGPGRHLGTVAYEVFSQATLERYLRAYGRWTARTAAWGPISFARPDFDPAGTIVDRCWTPHLDAAYRHDDDDAVELTALASVTGEPVERFGCPARIELRWRIERARPRIALDLRCFDRAACRLPDALWCSFRPRAPHLAGWRLDKLGQWIDPYDVLDDGNRRLHAVGDGGVRYREGAAGFALRTLDAALVCPGERELYAWPQRWPLMHHGVHANLWNNWWNTNFPYWDEDDYRFRFELAVDRD